MNNCGDNHTNAPPLKLSRGIILKKTFDNGNNIEIAANIPHNFLIKAMKSWNSVRKSFSLSLIIDSVPDAEILNIWICFRYSFDI